MTDEARRARKLLRNAGYVPLHRAGDRGLLTEKWESDDGNIVYVFRASGGSGWDVAHAKRGDPGFRRDIASGLPSKTAALKAAVNRLPGGAINGFEMDFDFSGGGL